MKLVVKLIFWLYIFLALLTGDCDAPCFDITESKTDQQKRLFLSHVEDVIFYFSFYMSFFYFRRLLSTFLKVLCSCVTCNFDSTFGADHLDNL